MAICWKEQVGKEMECRNDSWDNYVSSQPAMGAWFSEMFDGGPGDTNGTPFVLWTKNWVYFPLMYDGIEWVGSVPRHPNVVEYEPEHFGGG